APAGRRTSLPFLGTAAGARALATTPVQKSTAARSPWKAGHPVTASGGHVAHRTPIHATIPHLTARRGERTDAKSHRSWDRRGRDTGLRCRSRRDHLRRARWERAPGSRRLAGAARLFGRHMGDVFGNADLTDRVPDRRPLRPGR